MKKYLLIFFIFFSWFCFRLGGLGAFAQNPLVKMWDKRFGGKGTDILICFEETSDRGFILGGISSSSISGDKTQGNWGVGDYWIVKIDSIGNKEWDKTFGGTDDDHLQSLHQTKDGGFLLGGYSWSGISGDKTEANRDTIAPITTDYWVIKIDSLGNKEWDKVFGGTNHDYLYSATQTRDGGFILSGMPNSNISGDKSDSLWGGLYSDWWIVKIDSLGNKEWDKDIGGTYADYLYSVKQTDDGGYILGGSSAYGISGNKTQATWGLEDYWIVKTDSVGNKIWDKDFGGTNSDRMLSLHSTSDGGYILGGWSLSGMNGDKTEDSWGNYNYWIIKTDSLGDKEWDKDYGGTNGEDEFGNISQTFDKGFVLAGMSQSQISGNKTENNLGAYQAWVVKTDTSGMMQWDKTIFTFPEQKMNALVLQSHDGCYVVAQYSWSGVAGYKTELNRDTTNYSCDYWIVKFCDSTFIQANLTTTSNLCPGTCTDFVNLSFNATNYQWNFFGASPDTSTEVNPQNICYSTPGSYDVQLIATNANGSDTLLLGNYITVYPAPPPQSITQNGDTLFAIAAAGTYQWYFNGNIISGAINYFYVAHASGDYNVVCTDANGCEVEAAVFNVVAASPSQPPRRGGVEIHPNPVVDKIIIQKLEVKSGATVEISIYNILGVAVQSEIYNPNSEMKVDVSALAKGMYYIELSSPPPSGVGGLLRAKFVKQ